MKSTLRVDYEHSMLIMDRTFAKKAEDPATDEYKKLQRARRLSPFLCGAGSCDGC